MLGGKTLSIYHKLGDNCIVFEHFTVSIVDLMGEFHKNMNNSTVFEELSVSIVDLTDYFLLAEGI